MNTYSLTRNDLDGKIAMLFTNRATVLEAEHVLESTGIQIGIYFSPIEEAEALAKRLVEEGTRIIISRGGVSLCLRSVLSIPVVTIEYRYSDFARAIDQAATISKKIAVVSFNQAIHAAQRVEQYLDQGIKLVQIDDFHKFDAALKQLKDEGIDVVIGGHSAQILARKYGLSSVPMLTDPDAIVSAIIEARHTLGMLFQYELKLQTIMSILECAPGGIIAIDRNRVITNINSIAQRLLGLSDSSVIGKHYADALPFFDVIDKAFLGESVYREVFECKGDFIAVNCVPIITDHSITGAAISLQGAKEIQIMDGKIRKQMLNNGYVAKNTFQNIVGSSEEIQSAKQKAFTYASVDSTVLICGATGTGKELFAQGMHNCSPRRGQAFVAINCAALPETLLESELFGYVRGAFTGARAEGKAGIFELAHGGTIFLDEIGEMSMGLQSRLLRVLQEKEVVRIGGEKIIPIDVRVFAATNRNLIDEVNKGAFRADLYYRLSVLLLCLPTLGERKGDVRELTYHFVNSFARKYARAIQRIDDDAFAFLESMAFPGNVRELSNLIERSVVLCKRDHIGRSEIENAAYEDTRLSGGSVPSATLVTGATDSLAIPMELQRSLIIDALGKVGYNKAQAAVALGISRTTLWRKMRTLGIGFTR